MSVWRCARLHDKDFHAEQRAAGPLMLLTLFGVVAAAVGLALLAFKRPLRDFIFVLLFSAVFGSAEAVALPMLGGASLTVPYFFVFFVILRMLLVAFKNAPLLGEAIVSNVWIVLFAVYGVIAAMFFPRLFEGAISIVSMRPLPFRVPLVFTPQNITQAVYICLTALAAISAYTAARMPKSENTITYGWVLASCAFLLFAFVDLAGFYSGAGNLMDWARTATYAIVAQSEMGIRRISGSFTEPSSFATFGAVPLAYFSLFWLFDVKGAPSGALALALAMAMALSTSTTAFAMLALLFVVLVFGVVLVPMSGRVRMRKFLQLSGTIIMGLLAALVLVLLMPSFAKTFAELAEKMTVGKASSGSAIERGQWAAQGFLAFDVSRGLGVGPGSFRSSGLFQAVLGSLGVVGVICFAMQVFQMLWVLWRTRNAKKERFSSAAAMAALMMLVPLLASSAGPDPGILFGVMTGLALGRYKTSRVRAKLDREAAKAEALEAPTAAAPA